MTAQMPNFQYTRLAYQAQAVASVAAVFDDVRFYPAHRPQMNPYFKLDAMADVLLENIATVRAENGVKQGRLAVGARVKPLDLPPHANPANLTAEAIKAEFAVKARRSKPRNALVPDPDAPAPVGLNIDVLMETGTGKTFTFIETCFKLHQRHKLAKFIILVPSNAIRQGTIKSLKTTADFFAREYGNQKITVFNYSARTVQGFIQQSNAGISVLVATYQSFAGDSKVINKRGVEANLFGSAKSYMEALSALRPVMLIDEPHRFEGAKTQEYLAKFNPLFTLRFGATFKDDAYLNLVYTLDSFDAFQQKLVKSITVDTVGSTEPNTHALRYAAMGGAAGDRTARLEYQTLEGKNAAVSLSGKSNVGELTGIHYLDGYVVETITAKELVFTNGYALPLGEASSYGMLADDMQRLMMARTVANHFEREEALFKRGVKALSLFFIDAVGKYMPEVGSTAKPAVLRDCFEAAYRAELAVTLAKPDLDPAYRAYLQRSEGDIAAVHKGYFARSNTEKSEEAAVKLILEEKEKLLSFDTDLRFVFSMWALQEGWDNPNVFTLCKLAPSASKITKLQQIGRGLRLAVNQRLERIKADETDFDDINQLVVVVPATEGNFVEAIQSEIAAHSVKRISTQFDDAGLVNCGAVANAFLANRVLLLLESLGVVSLDEMGRAKIALDAAAFAAQRDGVAQALAAVKGVNVQPTLKFLENCIAGVTQVRDKAKAKSDVLTVNPQRYTAFKALWENLNRHATYDFELNTPKLIENVLVEIGRSFDVLPRMATVTTQTHVEDVLEVRSNTREYEVRPYSAYTLGEFVRALAQQTKLSYQTVATVLRRMPADKFAMIAKNENRALKVLVGKFEVCIYDLIVNKLSYDVREIKVQTMLTDAAGDLVANIKASSFGKNTVVMGNAAVREKSLFNEALMPVDSEIEQTTVRESSLDTISVFAKLPNIKIPTPIGAYNPDFGYVVQRGSAKALYLVVEAKGYDVLEQVGRSERFKIDSAKKFFAALQAHGFEASYQTKLNGDALTDLISSLGGASVAHD